MNLGVEVQQLLSLDNFKNWLLSKEEEEFVGISASKCNCPIATYLRERYPDCYIEISHGYVNLNDDGLVYIIKYSAIVHEFVRALDAFYNHEEQEVSKSLAFSILSFVEENFYGN